MMLLASGIVSLNLRLLALTSGRASNPKFKDSISAVHSTVRKANGRIETLWLTSVSSIRHVRLFQDNLAGFI